MLKTIKLNINKKVIINKKINNYNFFIINLKKAKITNKFIKYFINTFYTFYFRIIWRGKAYRVRYFKSNNKFTLNFGHSHWCKLFYDNFFFNFFKVKRQNYVIFFNYRKSIKFVEVFFNTIRVFNRYTRRGIRIKNIPTTRRFGKISQVNSSLNSFN
jgi:hypothetical protein